jgi:hypothetical protein
VLSSLVDTILPYTGFPNYLATIFEAISIIQLAISFIGASLRDRPY